MQAIPRANRAQARSCVSFSPPVVPECPPHEVSGQRRPRRAGGGASQSRPRAGLFMMKLLGAGPFWTAVAERSGDTAFAPGGAEPAGPGSRFARCQSGGAVRRLPDSATAVQNPPGPDPGSGHEPRPRTAPEVSGQSGSPRTSAIHCRANSTLGRPMSQSVLDRKIRYSTRPSRSHFRPRSHWSFISSIGIGRLLK